MPSVDALSAPGLTVPEVARRYRVGEDKVRGWIARGLLRAINRRDHRCGRPSWVVTPEALAAFEQERQAPTPPPKRRKKPSGFVDYYPD